MARTAKLKHIETTDDHRACYFCGWIGTDDDLIGYPVILPGRSNTWQCECPDCGQPMGEVY